jgi:hypothetical protein
MKIKKQITIIVVVLILLNLFTLLKLNSLKITVDSLLQQNAYLQTNLSSEISNIYSNIDEKLKKQESILDSYNVTFGDKLDTNNFTVPMTFSITPKEYSHGLIASLLLNGQSIEMKKDGNSFITTTDINIFNNVQLKVSLNLNGVQKIETIEEYNEFKGKYLLEIHGGFNGTSSFSLDEFKYKGNINLNYNGPINNNPVKISIVKDVNGITIDEQEVKIPGQMINLEVNDKIKLLANDIFTVYAKIQDNYGLNYKYIISSYKKDTNGNFNDSKYNEGYMEGNIEISDKNGNILYTPNYEMK